MKIVYRSVENSYDKLTEMLNNQLEIFDQLGSAINELVLLEDFQGKGADNIKAYYTELHGEVIRAFKALIHEIDITMYYSNQSFENDIDEAYAPIYESEYIQGKVGDQTIIEAAYENATASLNGILAGVSDIVTITSNFAFADVRQEFIDTIEYAKSAKEDFEQFNTDHEKDFADANIAIDNILLAMESMKLVGNIEKIEEYEPGSIDASEWMQGLRNYQLTVGEKIEENGWTSTFEALEAYNSLRTLQALIEGGVDIGVASNELRALYLAGIKFTLDEAADGTVIFKITSQFEHASDVQQALKKVGAGYISHAKIEELVTDGIKVVDEGGNIVNKRALQQLLKSDAIGDALKSVTEIKDYTEVGGDTLKIGKKLLGTVLNVVDVGVTLAFEGYDNVYNPTTGEFFQDCDGKTALDIVTDFGVEWGAPIGAAKIGATIGGFFGPIGAAIGGGIGAIVGIGFTSISDGEPPKTWADRAKDGIDEATDKVTEWFSNIFW